MKVYNHPYSLAEICASNAGFNIAIESEKISRIIFIFYLDQSAIILTVASGNKFLIFIH